MRLNQPGRQPGIGNAIPGRSALENSFYTTFDTESTQIIGGKPQQMWNSQLAMHAVDDVSTLLVTAHMSDWAVSLRLGIEQELPDAL